MHLVAGLGGEVTEILGATAHGQLGDLTPYLAGTTSKEVRELVDLEEIVRLFPESAAEGVIDEAGCDRGNSLVLQDVAVHVVTLVQRLQGLGHATLGVRQEILALLGEVRPLGLHLVAVVLAVSENVPVPSTGQTLLETGVKLAASLVSQSKAGLVYRSSFMVSHWVPAGQQESLATGHHQRKGENFVNTHCSVLILDV